MSQPEVEKIRRAMIEMTFVVASPLHVGTGERAPLIERVPEEREELAKEISAGDKSPSYRPMAMRRFKSTSGEEIKDRACVPGSTLKGALRAYLERQLDSKQRHEIFGISKGNEDETNAVRQIGRVRFNDCVVTKVPDFQDREPPLWSAERATAVRARVAIDPVTGAAASHQLTFFEFVPEGSELSVRLEASNISRSSLDVLGKLLARMTSQDFRLGSGAALCAGELRLKTKESLRVRSLDSKNLIRWVMGNGLNSIDDCYAPFEFAEYPARKAEDEVDGYSIELSIKTLDPLLVTSGLDRAEKDEEKKRKTDEHPDQLTVLQTPEGRIRIPASTFRGALRSRARKILILWVQEFWTRQAENNKESATIGDLAKNDFEAGKQVDRLLSSVFGSTERASAVQISDFLSTKKFRKSEQQLHHQYFNAIDRFSGGVAKGALYEASAAPTDTEFNGRLVFRTGISLPNWARLLLALVLRDLSMGDIPIGWGKAKGYGAVELDVGGKKISELLPFDLPHDDDSLIESIMKTLDSGQSVDQGAVENHQVSTNDQ